MSIVSRAVRLGDVTEIQQPGTICTRTASPLTLSESCHPPQPVNSFQYQLRSCVYGTPPLFIGGSGRGRRAGRRSAGGDGGAAVSVGGGAAGGYGEI